MEFNIRPLSESDYDEILVGWWNDWNWPPPPKDFLPDNGKGGIIVLDGDIPVCAGFMYATNSGIAWVEFIISNKQYKKRDKRKEALLLLVDTLTNVCRNTGFKYCYCLLKNKNLIKTYEKIGYGLGDSNAFEMIKIL